MFEKNCEEPDFGFTNISNAPSDTLAEHHSTYSWTINTSNAPSDTCAERGFDFDFTNTTSAPSDTRAERNSAICEEFYLITIYPSDK